ncbi:DUF6607 family protein [Hyphobacterium sp.]|uniref:DUF6607 family protein n=1 Tax=Hyphobacterium sp. TaxID=2004662 RepID=UPI003BAAD522
MLSRFAVVGALAFGLTACATTQSGTQTGGSAMMSTAAIAPLYERSEAEFQRDREAILAMAGEYDVTFDFREVVALQDGYELADDKLSEAREVVRVIEDTGDLIVMQHLLLTGEEDDAMVIKHWRQDWEYQPERMMAFRGHDNWDMVEISDAEAAGAWSQSVYQVDDSPRYAGLARWEHGEAISTWEPETSWRPLPRRDDTTRSDYHAIEAVNRHVVTAWGWVHEQDNTKLVVGEDGEFTPLVREVGVNTYVRTDLPNDSNADEYWAATADYWQLVRDYWDNLEATTTGFHVDDDAEGTLLYGPMLNASMRLFFGAETVDGAWTEAQELLNAQVDVQGAPERMAAAE